MAWKQKIKESTIEKVAVGMGLSYLWMEMTLNGSRAGWIAWKMQKGDCGVGMLIKNSSKNNIPRKAEVGR